MKAQFTTRFTKYYESVTRDSKMFDTDNAKYYMVFDLLPSITYIHHDGSKLDGQPKFDTLTIGFLLWAVTISF